jgi:hypothetical protein
MFHAGIIKPTLGIWPLRCDLGLEY